MIEKVSIQMQGRMVSKEADIRLLEAQTGAPKRIEGELPDLSPGDALTLGFSEAPVFLGFKSWRYDLRVLDKDGNFEAILHRKWGT